MSDFISHKKALKPNALIHEIASKGAVNIYGNTGPGTERWQVVKFTVAPLILPYKIVNGPVLAWSKIHHGPVEISI